MADLPAQLDYAQPLRWRQRKGFRRVVFALAGVVLILGSLKFLRPAWDHLRLLHYQGKCLAHVDAPRTIVFDGGIPARKADADWDRFYSLFSPPGGRFISTVFLGELRQKTGSPRLVAVDLRMTHRSGLPLEDLEILLDYQVIVPGGAIQRPRLGSNHSWAFPFDNGFGAVLSGQVLIQHIYAGQRDMKDPSHFTIEFDRGGDPKLVDVWLQSDDTLLFEARR